MEIILEDIIEDPQEIPSLPQVFYKLMESVNNPEISLEELSKIVSYDPGLTVQILKLVNSPFYNFYQRVGSISHAIEIIGIKKLTNIVAGILVVENFKNIPEDIVTMESFWAHSIATGIAAKKISERIFPDRKEEMYLLGMLHDIGSLIVYKHFPEKAKIALDRCNGWGMKLNDAEDTVFGFSHAQLGSSLLEKWGLQKFFKEAINYHHDPKMAKKFYTETAILHVADYIAMSNQIGSSGESQSVYLNPHVLDKLSITKIYIQEISELTIETFEKIFQIFFSIEPA